MNPNFRKSIFLGLLPIPVPCVSADSYRDKVIADTPAAYYRLGENLTSDPALDLSGNGLNGSFKNFAAADLAKNGPRPEQGFTDFSPGNLAPEFFVADRKAYIEAPDSSALDITGDLTVEAWVKLGATTNPNGGIVAKWRSVSGALDQRSYFLRMDGAKLRFGVSSDGTNAGIHHRTTTASLPTGEWLHLAAVYDTDPVASARSMKIFVNGTESATVSGGANATIPVSLNSGAAPLWIGAQFDATVASNFFDGNIDEVAIYAKALSPSDIAGHFTKGEPVDPFPETFAIWGAGVDPALAGPEQDHNGNGLPNLLEYWKGTRASDPIDRSPPFPYEFTAATGVGTVDVTTEVDQKAGPREDTAFVLQGSGDLKKWEGLAARVGNAPWTLRPGVSLDPVGGGSAKEARFTVDGEKYFIRGNVGLHEAPVMVKWATVEVPAAFSKNDTVEGENLTYGGDIRLGDLQNNGTGGFLVLRSEYNSLEDGGMKPVFLGAFDQNGDSLWSVGSGGYQPARPAPFVIYDIDGDGENEVIHFWKDTNFTAGATQMGDVSIQIRDAATGELEREATPATLPAVFKNQSGSDANWVHQRLLICNLRGLATPRDFVVKVGSRLYAFDDTLNLLWSYEILYNTRPNHTAYIPAIGDIDGDGRDEVTGGRYLLDDDGSVLFEDAAGDFTPHMDSVAIAPWDNGTLRVLASGGGHIVAADGTPVLALGDGSGPTWSRGKNRAIHLRAFRSHNSSSAGMAIRPRPSSWIQRGTSSKASISTALPTKPGWNRSSGGARTRPPISTTGASSGIRSRESPGISPTSLPCKARSAWAGTISSLRISMATAGRKPCSTTRGTNSSTSTVPTPHRPCQFPGFSRKNESTMSV